MKSMLSRCILPFSFVSCMCVSIPSCVYTLHPHVGRVSKDLYCKGLFGAVCGHAVPKMFVNVEAGEKRVYLHYIIWRLTGKGECPEFVCYDIACRTTQYFKRFEEEMKKDIELSSPGFRPSFGKTTVAGIKFGVGRWHAYGHESKCHNVWSMLYQDGFGMSDGEDMERLWHVLNAYAGGTSQMNLGNRNDNLSLVLFHLQDLKLRDLPDKLMTVCSFCLYIAWMSFVCDRC